MLNPESCWIADAKHREEWGRLRVASSVWWVAGGIWWRVAGGGWWVVGGGRPTSWHRSISVWILSLAHPPRRKLTMPHDHSIDNCSLRFYSSGRQLDLGESRSPTQIFPQNLLLASHGLWAYECSFGPGLMVMMATVMMAMVMMAMVMAAMVMVIIVPEALRQVGWLRQR